MVCVFYLNGSRWIIPLREEQRTKGVADCYEILLQTQQETVCLYKIQVRSCNSHRGSSGLRNWRGYQEDRGSQNYEMYIVEWQKSHTSGVDDDADGETNVPTYAILYSQTNFRSTIFYLLFLHVDISDTLCNLIFHDFFFG